MFMHLKNTGAPQTSQTLSAENTVQPVVYRELDTNDDSQTVNIGSMQINKNKLRGLFKKAGRLFNGKSKKDDANLQVANMQINTN